MPPEAEWNYKPPRLDDGRLHPDVYWFAFILDIRAHGPDEELWIQVAWCYSKRNLDDLVKEKPLIHSFLQHPYDIFLSTSSLIVGLMHHRAIRSLGPTELMKTDHVQLISVLAVECLSYTYHSIIRAQFLPTAPMSIHYFDDSLEDPGRISNSLWYWRYKLCLSNIQPKLTVSSKILNVVTKSHNVFRVTTCPALVKRCMILSWTDNIIAHIVRNGFTKSVLVNQLSRMKMKNLLNRAIPTLASC